MAFKLKSGNTTSFKLMGGSEKSPAKRKGIYQTTIDDVTGEETHTRISKSKAKILEEIEDKKKDKDLIITRTGQDSPDYKGQELTDLETGEEISEHADKVVPKNLNEAGEKKKHKRIDEQV